LQPEPESVEAGSPHVATMPFAVSKSSILHGPIRSAVFWLALPVLGEQALNAMVTWNDAFLAGRISPEATGAIGLAGYVGWLMTMLFWMSDTGATAIVARGIGARNFGEARRTTHQALILACISGIGGTVLINIVAPMFATLLNMHGPAHGIAVRFMRIDAMGYMGAAVSFALAACLRGAGDTRTPLMALGGVNVVNFVFSGLLCFGAGPIPAYGVDGIAWGTVIARWSGAVWLVVILLRGRDDVISTRQIPGGREGRKVLRGILRLRAAEVRPDKGLMWRILRIGLPAAADGAISFSGHFFFMMIVTRVPSVFPTAILFAAHTVGIRIESLSYLPATAFQVAASALVGQNLGAGQPERAELGARQAAKQAAILLGLISLVYFFAARPLFAFLSNDPRVWECGVPALRGLACVQIPLAILIVFIGALRGAGDTRTPMMLTAFGMACVRIPVSFIGGIVLKGGLLGAWSGMFADLVVRSILITNRFRAGKWKQVRV
jgi:MATE family multidrug resistance protein